LMHSFLLILILSIKMQHMSNPIQLRYLNACYLN
jgi:hypothetical protein